MKAFLLLTLALFIDVMQLLITLSFLGILAVPVIGQTVGPVGIIVGQVICFAISITFGGALVAFLFFNGSLYLRYLGPTSLVEMLFGFFPGWFLFTGGCLMKKAAAEGKLGGFMKVLGVFTSPIKSLAGAAVGGGAAAITAPFRSSTQEVANDNEPRTQKTQQPQRSTLQTLPDIRQKQKYAA